MLSFVQTVWCRRCGADGVVQTVFCGGFEGYTDRQGWWQVGCVTTSLVVNRILQLKGSREVTFSHSMTELNKPVETSVDAMPPRDPLERDPLDRDPLERSSPASGISRDPASLMGGRVFAGILQVIFGIMVIGVGCCLIDIRSKRESSGARQASTSLRIDLNEATENEIALAPGVGPVLAQRIIASRKQDGPFESLMDLRRVYGIGERTLDRIATIGFVRKKPAWKHPSTPTTRPSTGTVTPVPANPWLANR